MEKRLLLAVMLMLAVVFLVNILFPPTPPPRPESQAADTAQVTEGAPAESQRAEEVAVDTPEAVRPLDLPTEVTEEETAPEDTVWVTTPLYRLGFSERGARLVRAELTRYESLAPETKGQPVQLVPPGAEQFFSHRWLVGDDTLDLTEATFQPEPAGGLELGTEDAEGTLSFTYRHPRADFRLQLRYTFQRDRYLADVEGRLVGAPATGWWIVGLGPGLLSNESDPQEDYENNLAFAAKGPEGVQSEKIAEIEAAERLAMDGPFEWVAVRDKYFVVALVALEGEGVDRRFGGLQAVGASERFRAPGTASLPVTSDGSFGYRLYLGPQDYGRLADVGHDLEQVNPYGYKFLQPLLRPLVGAITALLVWSHNVLTISYGWILILFGIAIRVVLFPLYQKSMKAQMATMKVQPLMKEIQNKYKDEPQRMQQEMIKLYKEHKVNPVGGCLPMLVPFPILIALFFVFRDTIEFRGVPFLWLPDLSRPDPYYIIPVLMGISVFLLQWVVQRASPGSNPQMKIMMWVMPVVLTVLFLNFASGLNLYYATMNLASLPQQLYLAKERRAAADTSPATAKT